MPSNPKGFEKLVYEEVQRVIKLADEQVYKELKDWFTNTEFKGLSAFVNLKDQEDQEGK